ncbi:MAG: hypothetical protein Q8K21_17675 [Hydrogenophaga sp.]|uniref:hypothetical protein n=1 Tax=Hydrogenophaga sp. TaxID=1904254 RepID=UPI00272FBC8F|nr:hypothetical protein [Hydrogenophaga sp.]MDP2166013.1 hypothetical protein [Hydrogenophaga sp.]
MNKRFPPPLCPHAQRDRDGRPVESAWFCRHDRFGWQAQPPQITPITKAWCDHTKRLRDELKPGMVVSVEGPCG